MQVLCVSLSKDNTTVPGCFLKEKKNPTTALCVCVGGGVVEGNDTYLHVCGALWGKKTITLMEIFW